ncbi:MAG: type I DNA topoisomerase [Bacteroidetes bacterium]|nr:type I DNA topoisomerase [Bacteroidota bacterium]
MTKNLLIVESPAKAKTIEKILGKDFTVKSSYGHVRDLPKNDTAVDVKSDFKPKYVVTPDKKKVVSELKSWVKKVDEVWLATDEDREGEAISWHLCEVLGLDEKETKRIVFREITAPAIKQAITTPRSVDKHLVDAQQARRILDRLVGFELSELLWKKVKGKLSAGRVQSVTVKIVVDREREIQAFNAEPFFRVQALFSVEGPSGKPVMLKAELPGRLEAAGEAEQFLKDCIPATYEIDNIEHRPLKRKPAPPFTTSTLQQEASRKMGFAVKRTMSAAQRLYEQGFITYMRTDSISLSETAIASLAKEIESAYGDKYLQLRRFKNKKGGGAQEAHEAIRPTNASRTNVPGGSDEKRLYELIWKRAIASQMAEARLEKTVAKISISTKPGVFLQAEGEVLKFDGFLKVYLESKDDDEDGEAKGILPPLKEGQELPLVEMTATERFTRPPARFTEASLVKKLEELGIGRPSTYAPTISKIMEAGRGYIIKEKRDGEEREFRIFTLADKEVKAKKDKELTGAINNRLVPTDMGMIVSDFLTEHFQGIMDYGFTADIEKKFDEIADGKEEWTKMLKEFYFPFHERVEDTLENAERASGERILGIDPESGRTLLVRMSRLGRPVVQIGKPDELDEGEKPKYANLRPRQSLESLEFEEALELFKLPRDLGEYDGKSVTIGVGRYGPYVRHGEDQFISLGRGEDPMEVGMDRAVELIEEKRKADAPVGTYKGEPIQRGKGRFGPFLKWNGMFVNIPRKYEPENLTIEEMHELIEKKVQKEANRYIQRWPDEGIDLENGRWGPFIRFKKKSVKIPKKEDGQRVTPEEAKEFSLEEVKKMIEAEIPGAFKKKAAKKKKAAPKKKKK